MGFNKKGDKYYLLISIILGILVMSFSLYFLFQGYFTQENIDWEICRQSVVMRANLPEADLKVLGTDVKGAYPLRCKTEVVNIDKVDSPEEVYRPIAQNIASSWYAYGSGEMDFIHRDFVNSKRTCLAVLRIHFDQKAIIDYEEMKIQNLKITDAGYNRGFYTYYQLNYVGNSNNTYNQYLPLISPLDIENKISSKKALVALDPIYPKEKDILVVYVLDRKNAGLMNNWNVFLKFWMSPLFSIYQFGEEYFEEYGTYAQQLNLERSFVLISPEEIGSLGCEEFLTIPA